MTTSSRYARLVPSFVIGSAMMMAIMFHSSVAVAADSLGYQISPPVTELRLDAGGSIRATVKVTNLSNQQISLVVGKQNFVAKGEEGEVELIDAADSRYSLAPWFVLTQPTVDVPPRTTREVEYTLAVPKNAEPGGRYASITFNTIPTTLPTGQSGASVKQQLAALVFLRINGDSNDQLAIDSFRTINKFYEYGPVSFETRIKNLGNVHEKPTGEIVVTNMLGMKTATVKLDEKNVIPGAVRKLNSELKNKWLFGSYKAKLTLKNGTQQTLTASTSFTALPYKVVAVVIVLLILLGVFWWKTRKRWLRALRILAGRE